MKSLLSLISATACGLAALAVARPLVRITYNLLFGDISREIPAGGVSIGNAPLLFVLLSAVIWVFAFRWGWKLPIRLGIKSETEPEVANKSQSKVRMFFTIWAPHFLVWVIVGSAMMIFIPERNGSTDSVGLGAAFESILVMLLFFGGLIAGSLRLIEKPYDKSGAYLAALFGLYTIFLFESLPKLFYPFM